MFVCKRRKQTMFGFGNDKGNDKKTEKKREYDNTRDLYIPAAISDTFGTCDPEKINEIFRTYMPEITNAILETKAATLNTEQGVATVTKNQLAIHEDLTKNSNEKHDELLIRLDSLEKQNKELQERVWCYVKI